MHVQTLSSTFPGGSYMVARTFRNGGEGQFFKGFSLERIAVRLSLAGYCLARTKWIAPGKMFAYFDKGDNDQVITFSECAAEFAPHTIREDGPSRYLIGFYDPNGDWVQESEWTDRLNAQTYLMQINQTGKTRLTREGAK